MRAESTVQKKVAAKMVEGEIEYLSAMRAAINKGWGNIAPFWPLKNLIATNPLQGLEEVPFEQAITQGHGYFQQPTIPEKMEGINRATIKWCQAFFDEGQAIITMPYRDQGLYQAWRQLVQFDKQVHQNKMQRLILLENLPTSAEQAIASCLLKLNISIEQSALFFTLLLTTLAGWASHVKYRAEWAGHSHDSVNSVLKLDYLAIRLVITCCLWPNANELLLWHENTKPICVSTLMTKIMAAEKKYQTPLLHALSTQGTRQKIKSGLPRAQLIFCIDVRSEPFRRALESQGNYETFGFAGFFGIPTQIKNELTDEIYSSCPVLLRPKHSVHEKIFCPNKIAKKVALGKEQINTAKKLYQALKYTLTTPFALVEALGLWSGLWMSFRTIAPSTSAWLKNKFLTFFQPTPPVMPHLVKADDDTGIDFNDQCAYAENILRTIDLVQHFAPLVVLCSHGSATQNNAYASSLDCGACGGHTGAANARILAAILNNLNVRHYLAKKGITIPSRTRFIAALHNTTTDEVIFYPGENDSLTDEYNDFLHDLAAARRINSRWRCEQMGYRKTGQHDQDYIVHVKNRSLDWAQTRPEWGLARNASFIVGPRDLTKEVNLDGRAFLHSYNWQQDQDGTLLTTILTAPMIVAQWINNQYLFSSLDNVAYGSGSKITHNITGKIGIMQGNGSDLMHGLPLQSINSSDTKAYHETVRLLTIVCAPRSLISRIISQQVVLQKLFGNGWVSLVCIEPDVSTLYHLERDLTWSMKQPTNPHLS